MMAILASAAQAGVSMQGVDLGFDADENEEELDQL